MTQVLVTYLYIMCRKCADGVAEAQGSTMAIEFILNSPGEWDVLPKNGQVLSKVRLTQICE